MVSKSTLQGSAHFSAPSDVHRRLFVTSYQLLNATCSLPPCLSGRYGDGQEMHLSLTLLFESSLHSRFPAVWQKYWTTCNNQGYQGSSPAIHYQPTAQAFHCFTLFYTDTGEKANSSNSQQERVYLPQLWTPQSKQSKYEWILLNACQLPTYFSK